MVSSSCFLFSHNLFQHHWMSGCDPGTLIPLFWIDIYWYSLPYQFSKLSANTWLNGDHCLNLSGPRLIYHQYLFQLVAFHILWLRSSSSTLILFQSAFRFWMSSHLPLPLCQVCPSPFCYWFHYYKYFSCFFLFNCCNLFSTKSSNDADTSLTF